MKNFVIKVFLSLVYQSEIKSSEKLFSSKVSETLLNISSQSAYEVTILIDGNVLFRIFIDKSGLNSCTSHNNGCCVSHN